MPGLRSRSARAASPHPRHNQVRTELFAMLDDRPVTDLAAGEVQILEDGVPQTIDRFDLVQPRVARRRACRWSSSWTRYHSSIEESRPLRAALARALEDGHVAARPRGADLPGAASRPS